MKYFLLITFISLLSINALAGHSFGLELASTSATIDGTSKTDSTEGVIVSPSNMNYKLLYTWSMSHFFHMNLGVGKKSYTFVDEDNIITNGKEHSGSVYDLGVKLIFASWGALSFKQVSDFDASYSVVDTTSIKVEAENINFLRIVYHQLLMNLGSMILAIDVNYDLEGKNSYLDSRSATGFKGYFKFNNNGWGLDLFLDMQKITKDNEEKEFKQTDTTLGSSIYMFF